MAESVLCLGVALGLFRKLPRGLLVAQVEVPMPAVSRVSRTAILRLLVGAMVLPGSLSARQTAPSRPAKNYWVYVGAASAQLIQTVRFDTNGTVLDETIP